MNNSNSESGISSASLLALAVIFLLPWFTTSAHAQPEFEVSGKARLRYEDTQFYKPAFQRSAFWSIRIRPQITIKADDHASLVIEPQFAKALGRDYSYTQADSSGTTVYNENFHMHQGYLKLRFSDEFQIKGGRISLDYGSGSILGVGDWGTYGRSFDGALLLYKNSLVSVDVAHLKLDSTANTIDSDRELAYAYTAWNLLEELKAFEVYGLYESNRFSGANEHRHSVGARAKAKISNLDGSVEYAMEKGSSSYVAADQTGSMLMAELGYSFPDLAKLRIGVEFDQANESWREWYPTTKSALGRNDVVGRRNLTALALRTKANISDKVSMNFDYWMFNRTSTSAPAYRTADTEVVGTTTASASQDIGSSTELSIKYALSEKVEYGVGAALFSQGSYLKENFGDRALTDFYAMVNVEF